MNNILAVFKREMRYYFFSPLAYVIYVLFIGLCGLFFSMNFTYYTEMSNEFMAMATAQQSMYGPPPSLPNYTQVVLLGVTGVMTFILLFIAPMISMRLFSEEKKMGTMELLFTYPIKDIEVLMGKFLSAIAVFGGMLALTLVYSLISLYLVPDQTFFPVIFASYLGVFLMGTAFISFGLFTSAITENQIVSGLVSFAVLLVLWMIGFVADISPGLIGDICKEISIYSHFELFNRGVIDTGHIAYYVLFSVFFLFASLRVLELNRWRG